MWGRACLRFRLPQRARAGFGRERALCTKRSVMRRCEKQLQRKGTRSATRRLRQISGRERRFKLAVSHTVAKSRVERYPHALFGLKELIGKRGSERAAHGARVPRRSSQRRTGAWPQSAKCGKCRRQSRRRSYPADVPPAFFNSVVTVFIPKSSCARLLPPSTSRERI